MNVPEILILCRETTTDVDALERELSQRGRAVETLRPSEITIDCDTGNVRVMAGGRTLSPGVVVGWTSLHEAPFGNTLLAVFEHLGVPVVNGDMPLGQSKVMTSVLLAKAGLPHIRTMICGSRADLQAVPERLGLPCCVKPIVGAYGRGVRLLHTMADLDAALEDNRPSNQPLYLQQAIEKPGRDIRVQCANYRPVFSFYRIGKPGEFVTNLAAGGMVDWPVDLPPEGFTLAEAAARLFKAPMAGIDFIEAPDGLRIVEVNTVPGFRTIMDYAHRHAEEVRPYSDRASAAFADLVEAELAAPAGPSASAAE